MRTALLTLLVTFASPALADECAYVSGFDVGEIQFLDGEKARVEYTGQAAELCGVNAGDDGGDIIVCASGDGGTFNFASAVYGGSDRDLLVFEDHVWYRRCYEPA